MLFVIIEIGSACWDCLRCSLEVILSTGRGKGLVLLLQYFIKAVRAEVAWDAPRMWYSPRDGARGLSCSTPGWSSSCGQCSHGCTQWYIYDSGQIVQFRPWVVFFSSRKRDRASTTTYLLHMLCLYDLNVKKLLHVYTCLLVRKLEIIL